MTQGQPFQNDDVNQDDVLLASATVGKYDDERYGRLMSMSDSEPLPATSNEDEAYLGELQVLRQQREELLGHVSELVQQRDAYRSRMHRLERSCHAAREEVRRLREERDEALRRLPVDDLHRPTERQLHSPHNRNPKREARSSERPEGAYCLQGDDVPVDEEVCVRTSLRKASR